MNQMSEQELRDAVIATKKDVKLVAAARNDRMNSAETLHKEFSKLPVDRQREIIASVANDHFVGAQWKVAFPLNNLPAANLADGISAAGRALFFSREEDSIKQTIHAIRVYQESPFYKTLAAGLGEAAEIVRSDLVHVSRILTSPDVYGLIQSLDPAAPVSEKIVKSIVRVATYTRDEEATLAVAKFLHARRHSVALEAISRVIENSVFMARGRKSVREILAGLGAGSVDRVLERYREDHSVQSKIGDVAWKTRDARAIRTYLEAL
jgi:hypothetical protein